MDTVRHLLANLCIILNFWFLLSIAAAAAAAKAEAEAEEAERKEAEGNKMTSLENLKYYTSLFLGTVCIVNVFAFLFLVPFVLDPAISTLRHRWVLNRNICDCS